MTIGRLLVLLPCHSLDDLAIERDATEAEQLLSAWTALYHPALLHTAHSMPNWVSAHMASREVSNALVILPECAEAALPEDWLAAAESSAAVVLRKIADRSALVAAAMEHLEERPPEVEADLVADFFAVGFCHLMVELLTRKLRYMSNLDETAFRTALLAAADAAVQGDGDNARSHVQTALDRLHDAREYFYPTEPRLLDLTLLASTTVGESLRRDLEDGGAHACTQPISEENPSSAHEQAPDMAEESPTRASEHAPYMTLPRNLMLSGEVLEEMVAREPLSLEALKVALANKTAAIIGGEYAEMPLPLLPPEAILKNLERGIETYQRHLECRPTIFGRRKFGLTLALPRILNTAGFSAALHFTLDDGQFPTGNQSRIQWEGFDGEAIKALARVPADAAKADAFLALPKRLASCMELDHSPALIFAHWPGRVSPWYEDLRRIAKYSRALGGFSTLDEFFEQTLLTGQRVPYQIDGYRSPYLTQDAADGNQDAISRWVRYYRRKSMADARKTFNTLSRILAGEKNVGSDERSAGPSEFPNPSSSNDQVDEQVDELLELSGTQFAECLRGKSPSGKDNRSLEKGYLVLNPWSFSRREGVKLPELAGTPEVGDAVRAAAENAAIVDLPSMGFVWIESGSKESSEQAKSPEEPPLAGEHSLRNEYFEIHFDPVTGAIRAVSDYKSRHPRLAQQIALRMPQSESDSTSDQNYSIMAADEFQITSSGPVVGEAICRGRLMDRQGERVAGFEQTTRIWRGSRVIEMEIEIDPVRLPEGRPWDSYYACRFAWHNEGCSFFRNVNFANQPTAVAQLESPLFVDIRSGKLRTTILSGGMPYHRRLGPRKLDTLLIVPGETARKFRLGIALDVLNPTTTALGFIAPPITLYGSFKPPANSGWLFHLDHRNVIATAWFPLPAQSGDEPQNGFRVRLLETEGRPAELRLRCLHTVASARKLETGDTPSAELNVEADAVHVPMSPHQWIEVEVFFQR